MAILPYIGFPDRDVLSRLHVGRTRVVGIIGFACLCGMSYGFGRIGTILIPDNSKPTATWGRKAMGQRGFSSAIDRGGRQVTEGIPHELVAHLAVGRPPRQAGAAAPKSFPRPPRCR